MGQRQSEGYQVLGLKRRGKPEDCEPIEADGEPTAPLQVRWPDGITWTVPHILAQDYNAKRMSQANHLKDTYTISSNV